MGTSVNIYLILAILAGVLALISFIVGVILIIRYFKTRNIGLLISGLLLTFILPGVCICLAVMAFLPSVMIAYGPPPGP